MDRNFEDGLKFSKTLDRQDELARFKEKFYLKDEVIYMCGSSLGLASKDAEEALLRAIERWKQDGVKIWSHDNSKYFRMSSNLANLMAPIVGADPDEIAFVCSTTTNIHQVISTFYKPTKDKYKIIVDDMNFPTDRYAIDSQVRLHGYDSEEAVKVVKGGNYFFNEDDFIEAMTSDVALVFLPAVYYRTAQILDIKKITKAAKDRNILIGWDLCHAVGAIEIDFKSLDCDFAVWCTYKYLNGGPGSPAAIYLNRQHFKRLPGLAGWFGNKLVTQFFLRQEFEHEESASGLQIGTPFIFSMSTLEGSLKIVNEAGISAIRKKSLHITAYLMFLVENKLIKYGFSIGNPREDEKRGGHVCLKHDDGYKICLNLKARDVVSDFRDPNIIRLTPVALYVSYVDVYNVVNILVKIMETQSYKQFGDTRHLVV